MKLRKLARQLTAAALAGCMALSLSLPALAETWNLSNADVRVYVNADGSQCVDGYGTEQQGQTGFADAAPEIKSDGRTKNHIHLDTANGDVRATLASLESYAYSGDSYEDIPPRIEVTGSHDATLTIDGTVDLYNNNAWFDDSYLVNNSGTLTLNGIGTLNLGTKSESSIYHGIKGGRIIVDGPTIHITETRYDDIYCSSGLEIRSGTVNALTNGIKSDGDIQITGGTVNAKKFVVSSGKVILSGNAKVTVTEPMTAAQVEALFEIRGGSLTYTDPDSGETITEEVSLPQTSGYASGDIGGAIATAVVGGAAVWGGYEAATRIILHKLLPEGAAIPKTQAELALLVWNTAGRPEPVSAPAFADVDETTAKAAQWCTEQGLLDGSFAPDRHVTKYRVIRVWKRAFPTR